MKHLHIVCLATVLVVLAGPARAEENAPDDQQRRGHAPYPDVSLAEVLDSVGKAHDRVFLTDRRVPARVVVGQLTPDEVDYSALLIILRNNQLAAIAQGRTTNIVPASVIRQYPLPVLFEDDKSLDDNEWVTRVVHLENAPAPSMVPILRPLLPREGHLAASAPSNTILIVDRLGNARRVVSMISKLDASAAPRRE